MASDTPFVALRLRFVNSYTLAYVTRNVLQSVTVPLLLPHLLSGTACQRRCGHPHRCSWSGVGSSDEFFRRSLVPKTLHWLYFSCNV